ncbi:unnamed protein product [Symbiodinium sp. CCMP2592]|nr:unnamed protein product [Symbiodinium sp. CCMP2592]
MGGDSPQTPQRGESAAYFYIGDPGPQTPVVLHRFRPRDRHGKAVHVSPAAVFVEACLSLAVAAGQKLITIDTKLPECHCFGEFPGAFVEGRLAPAPLLFALLKAQRLACEVPCIGSQAAWAARVEATLAPLVSLVLWAFGPCYRRHTRAAVLRGSCLAAWPVSLIFCLRRRWRARQGIDSVRGAIKSLEPELRRFLEDWEDRSRRLSASEAPSLDELAFRELCPLAPELQQWLRGSTEAIGARLEIARSQETSSAPLRWASTEEVVECSEESSTRIPKLLLDRASEARGVASAGPSVMEVTEMKQMWMNVSGGFKTAWTTFWRAETVDVEDGIASQPLSASQVRGNWIFAACVLSTTLGFVAVSLRSSQPVERSG